MNETHTDPNCPSCGNNDRKLWGWLYPKEGFPLRKFRCPSCRDEFIHHSNGIRST